MEQLTPALVFQQNNCFQQSTKMRCPPPTIAWSNINTYAGVTTGTWAAHLRDCMIELHNTSQNPSETNPYPQKPNQHATAKQKSQQSKIVILQLDFSYYKMTNAPNSTTISNFQFWLKHELHYTLQS